MTTCLKCGFENDSVADPLDPLAECPRCGAIYSRVAAALAAKTSGPAATPVAARAPRPEAAPVVDPVEVPAASWDERVATLKNWAWTASDRLEPLRPRFRSAETQRRLLYGACGVLALATFFPFASVPILGTFNLIGNGSRAGMLLLIGAGVCAWAASRGRLTTVAWVGGLQLALVAYLLLRIGWTSNTLASESGDGEFAKAMAQAAGAAIQFEFGALVVLVAAVCILVVGLGRSSYMDSTTDFDSSVAGSSHDQ